jgi:hypothetical protein
MPQLDLGREHLRSPNEESVGEGVSHSIMRLKHGGFGS